MQYATRNTFIDLFFRNDLFFRMAVFAKKHKHAYIIFLTIICLPNWVFGAEKSTAELTAKEIVHVADAVRFPKEAFEVDLEMVTIKSSGRKLVRRMKVLSHGQDKVLVEFYYPAREKGRALLMVDDNMWMAIPDLKRTIRVSAHQRLMGSDFSNGDVVRINLAKDYTARIVKTESIETPVVRGFNPRTTGVSVDAYLLELKANNRKVSYDRILYWVRRDNFWPMRLEFYALSGRLLKTLNFTKFAEAAGRVRPIGMTMESPLNPGQKTLMTFSNMHRTELSDDIFRKSYLERR